MESSDSREEVLSALRRTAREMRTTAATLWALTVGSVVALWFDFRWAELLAIACPIGAVAATCLAWWMYRENARLEAQRQELLDAIERELRS